MLATLRFSAPNGTTLEGEHDDEMLDAARCMEYWRQYPRGAGLESACRNLATYAPEGWRVTHDFGGTPQAPEGAKLIRCGGWGQRSRDPISCANLYIYKQATRPQGGD